MLIHRGRLNQRVNAAFQHIFLWLEIYLWKPNSRTFLLLSWPLVAQNLKLGEKLSDIIKKSAQTVPTQFLKRLIKEDEEEQGEDEGEKG